MSSTNRISAKNSHSSASKTQMLHPDQDESDSRGSPNLSFDDAFKAECIKGSAIAPSLYTAAVQFIEDTGFYQPNEALNHTVSRFWQYQKPHTFGIFAGFYQESGELWQGKAEHPRTDKNGRSIKYEYPIGIGARAYLPPIPKEIRTMMPGAECPLEGAFWHWLEGRPDIPIVVTEGAKKALSLLSQGIPAIALLGVNAGVLKNDKIGGVTVRKLTPELVPGLAQFAVPGREFIIAFDQDDKPKTRRKVEDATGDLAFWLEKAGASVRIASWDKTDGKGIDDLIVYRGFEYASQKLDAAIRYGHHKIQHTLARQLTRTPQLHIGSDEFMQHVDQFPASGILALSGGKGTGKGKSIAKMLHARRWLSATTLRSLAREQGTSWGGVFVQDGDRHGTYLLKDGEPINGGAVCIPSLLKVQSVRADVFVLDELPAILDFLLTSKLANKDGMRPLLLDELARRIREAALVICASADLTEDALRWVENIRGERSFLVQTDRKPLGYAAHVIDGKKHQVIAQFIQRVEDLSKQGKGQILLLHTDSKALADKVSARLLEKGHESLLITADTSGGEIEASFLESKGRDIPSLSLMGVKAIITSPSVKEGFSIEHYTDRIDSVWGIFQGGSITAHAIAQTCDRVRSLTPRFLWMAEKGRAYSQISRAETVTAFMREFKRSSDALVKLTRRSLLSEAELKVDALDWQSDNMRMVAALEVQRNKGMKALKDTVIALLEKEGKQIIHQPSMMSKEQAFVELQALREISTKLEMARAIAIETAPALDEATAEALTRKDALSPAEQLSLEKYYLERFYRTPITRDEVIWDKNGKRRSMIRTLEAILNPDTAEEVSAASINQNPDTPQDWKNVKLQQWVYQQSGASKLIHSIWAGEITALSDELVSPIGQWLKRYAKDAAIALNFSGIARVSERQAAFLLLDKCGLTRHSQRARSDGKVIRLYFVDVDNLARLKSIVGRRQSADPSVQTIDLNRIGGSPEIFSELPCDLAKEVAELWAIADTEEARAEVLRLVETMRSTNNAA